MARVNGKDF